ncbi:cupin domain-containing protein [Microbispora cellulosiformans]|uniref:Cupin domain-containing protein n=1 Tax=Microbispora cellulosiformans TaxID=2614688 RepID=A0A5J5K9L7_9ACTN|nr:cupin domain-containing protein [Microbispora cellulosiformans]
MPTLNPLDPPGFSIVNLPDVARTVPEHGVPVHGADALGTAILSNGHLGADVLWVPAGARFPVHTHPGHHLLYCVSGSGTITIAARTYDVRPGDIYMVDGQVPHAVGAGDEDHVLLSIGAPHKPIESPDRMRLTNWSGGLLDDPMFVEGAPAGERSP